MYAAINKCVTGRLPFALNKHKAFFSTLIENAIKLIEFKKTSQSKKTDKKKKIKVSNLQIHRDSWYTCEVKGNNSNTDHAPIRLNLVIT